MEKVAKDFNLHSKELVCDFDETLIDKDLESEFVKFYRKYHAGPMDYLLAAFSLPVNFILKVFHVRNLLKAWTFNKNEKDLLLLFDNFLKVSDIRLNRKVVNFVGEFDGKKTLLTGCHELLAKTYLKQNNHENLFDSVIGTKTTFKGLILLQHPFGRSKLNFIDRPDIGIGNSIFDRYFLEKCKLPLIFNPDKDLVDLAKKLGWREL